MERRQAKWRGRCCQGVCFSFLLLILAACTPWVPLAAPVEALPQPTGTAYQPATVTPSPLPTLPPTATTDPGCTDTQGTLIDQSIESESVGKAVPFIVYTPPCYDPQAQIRYPVVYMFHGQSYTQDQWVRLGMPAAADRLITAGELPPFLIVMPYEEFNLHNPFEKGFEKAVIEEIIPWVDANFATCTQRPCRAIGGLSRGGSWALYLGIAHWEMFGSIGAHSTAPFFGMDGWLSYYLGKMGKENFPRLYVDFGETDSLLSYMTEFQKKLDGYKLDYEFHLRPGNHTEEYWSANVEEYLRWYWKLWSPAEE
ncbi:MAG TPA: alpha/beta hydrolase-fold protein [Bellilinea sp.]